MHRYLDQSTSGRDKSVSHDLLNRRPLLRLSLETPADQALRGSDNFLTRICLLPTKHRSELVIADRIPGAEPALVLLKQQLIVADILCE